MCGLVGELESSFKCIFIDCFIFCIWGPGDQEIEPKEIYKGELKYTQLNFNKYLFYSRNCFDVSEHKPEKTDGFEFIMKTYHLREPYTVSIKMKFQEPIKKYEEPKKRRKI